VEVEGKYTKEERKQLTAQLEQAIHDSVRVSKQRKFLFWLELKNPNVYDSTYAAQSGIYMSAVLNSLGYYRDSIRFTDTVKVVDDQQRTTVNFVVIPGQLFKLDSVWYDMKDSITASPRIDTLQMVTDQSLNESLLKRGEPFSKGLISGELDRLSDVYRNNGYLRFSRDQLLSVWDTVGPGVLAVNFDPIEQARQLEELRRRRENPTADVEIRLRPNPDTSKLLRYYVGTVRIYPDINIDSLYYEPTTTILTRSRYEFISYAGLFNPRKLIRFIYLDRGDLYRQSNYLRTQNKFSSLPAWRLVTINQIPRPGQDTVDFEVRLIPAEKLNARINFDVSRNQGNLGSEGNLLGLGASLSLVNRNFIKGANVSSWNLRYGIELATRIDSIQTQQLTLSHNIQFPRLVPRMTWLPASVREDGRTFLSLNAGYTDRLKYFAVSTFNASWGYEFTWKKMLLGIRLPNIEYNKVQQRQLLRDLIAINQSYQYIFNDGLIISTLGNITIPWGKKNVTNLVRIAGEESGIITGLFRKAFNSTLYSFLKLDAEFVQTHIIGPRKRSAFAWRLFGGIGYRISFDQDDPNQRYMPFFRQYYAGGPNSMRAWSVRKLGPGSSVKSFARDIAPDRFGDIRLEANAEYRFFMVELYGYTLEGALYTDMGNVWFRKPNPDFVNGEFRLSRLWKDLAIGAGTGLRIDFGFLKARFDYAYKVKDPSPGDPASQNKWFYDWKPLNGQFQLGINYPF
jgi:outer membrane protein assembly factor BamA